MSGTEARRAVAVSLALTLTALGLSAHDQVPGETPEGPVLLTGGDVYTVSGEILEATDLLFAGGEIVEIGVGLTVPEGTEVIDVSGSRVYPGLIAPQTVLGLVEIGAVRATRDLDEVGDINPEVAAHVAYNPDSEHTPTVRSHGVTTAQITPQGGGIAGRNFLTHLDGWTKEDAGIRLTDGIVVNWPSVTVSTSRFAPPAEQQRERSQRQRDEIRQAFERARDYHAAREAGLADEIDLRWEAMRPLWSGGEKVFVNAGDYRQIVEAVSFAQEFGVELVLVGAADAYKAAELLRDAGVAVILDASTGLPPRQDDDYDTQYKHARLLHEAGVKFCIGLINQGWGARNLAIEGAGHAIAHGLPADVALRSITLSTAEILGLDETQGSLEVGKEATLFVSTGDVMDTLTQNVTHMYIRGRPVDLDNRHRRLARKYAEKIHRAAGSQ